MNGRYIWFWPTLTLIIELKKWWPIKLTRACSSRCLACCSLMLSSNGVGSAVMSSICVQMGQAAYHQFACKSGKQPFSHVICLRANGTSSISVTSSICAQMGQAAYHSRHQFARKLGKQHFSHVTCLRANGTSSFSFMSFVCVQMGQAALPSYHPYACHAKTWHTFTNQ